MKLTIDKANVTIENGKVIIDMDPVQINNILFSEKVQLSTLKPKDIFKIGDEEFIVLEQSGITTKVISKNFLNNRIAFGKDADWTHSPIRSELNNDYYNKIAKIIGIKNIVHMRRDLTSLDGLDDYSYCVDSISLLSISEYAKYHKILGLKCSYPDEQWTITPASAPSNNYACRVCTIKPYGTLSWNDCSFSNGIRPFFTLDSSIYVFKS